ncbi:MAG: cytochrome c oxidase subunit 3 [Planctomycetota bacterium]|jgi:heme/copper-type cytochrome/quinol oxidase subunit 3
MANTATADGTEIAMHGPDRVEPSPFPLPWQKLMMWIFLLSDGMGFVGLLGAYAFVRYLAPEWPMLEWFEGGHMHETLSTWLASNPGQSLTAFEVFGNLGIYMTSATTFILICSSVTMVKAFAACQEGDQKGLRKYLLFTIIGGALFLGGQVFEWTHLIHEGFTPAHNPMAATFFALTGFHGAHVLSGVIYLIIIWLKSADGRYGSDNSVPVENVGLFWHFVDLVWIVVFTVIYLF